VAYSKHWSAGGQKYGYAPAESQIESLARKLFEGANNSISKLILQKMTTEEIMQHLDGVKLSNDLKTQILMTFPKMHKLIDANTLDADQRVILLCTRPTVAAMKKFDVNADDLILRQYRYMLQIGGRKIMQFVYDNISDEKISLFGVNEWGHLLASCRNSARRLKITYIRNPSDLRNLVLDKPYIMYHQTVEDMQNSVIDGPTWIRIITKMRVKDRGHIPKGFKAWVARDVFKKKLTGRKFKSFSPDWTNGMQE
jgi:hypothetical protein